MVQIPEMDILSLIPQREPMLMISGLLSAGEDCITTWFKIGQDNIFLEDGLFREGGLLENIAQSAAALNGYRANLAGEPVKNGYIGAVKNLEVHKLPRVSEQLSTRVEEIHQVMDASIIQGEVRAAGQLIARCEMKVFMQA